MASYDGLYDDVGFTISAYASSPISWVPLRTDMLYIEKVMRFCCSFAILCSTAKCVQMTGALTTKTAGGNPSLPTFMNNPQYHLRIHPDKSSQKTDSSTRKSQVSVVLSGDRRLPFNVSVLWSEGQRITDLARNNVALSTGPYQFGHASGMKALAGIRDCSLPLIIFTHVP